MIIVKYFLLVNVFLLGVMVNRVPLPVCAADPAVLKIVSIGASYASGHGIDPQIDGSCHRSGVNYAHQIAAALHAELTDVTCSGATTDDFTTPQRAPWVINQPQYRALTGDHDIVLIAIGSNDIQLIQSTIFCQFEQGFSHDCPGNRANTTKRVPGWERKIKNVYTHVRLLEPRAKIYAISYGQPLATAQNSCSHAPWNYSNRMWVQHYFTELSTYTKEDVLAVHGQYIDTPAIAEGHEICSADPWYVGTESAHGDGFILHPKKKWHDSIAAKILQLIHAQN